MRGGLSIYRSRSRLVVKVNWNQRVASTLAIGKLPTAINLATLGRRFQGGERGRISHDVSVHDDLCITIPHLEVWYSRGGALLQMCYGKLHKVV